MDEAALNSLVEEARQSYAELVKIVPPEEFAAAKDLLRAQTISAFRFASKILAKLAEIEASLGAATLDGTAQAISEGLRNFLRETLLPARDRLTELVFHLADALEMDLDTLPKREEGHVPIWNIFESGVYNFSSWSEYEEIDIDDDLNKATRVLNADFFQPDEWLANAERLQPVLGERADKRLTAPVRFRLREIYLSFVFGNFMAAIALTRSLLEYALIDRASIIGIDPASKDPRYDTKPLKDLVEDASAKLPELRHDMETIKEFGNQVLHPKPKRKTVPLHDVLIFPATQAVSAISRVVEGVYLQTATKSRAVPPFSGSNQPT